MSATSDFVLGENVDTTFFHPISNTDDDPRNNNDSFVNTPFGGLGFNKTANWSVALTEASLPRTNHLDISKQLWFKRWTFPERCNIDAGKANPGYTKMYYLMGDEGYLGYNYSHILNTLPKIRPRPDLAETIIEGKDKNTYPLDYPKELENFLLTSYNEYSCPQAYFMDSTVHDRVPDLKHPTSFSEGYLGISSSLNEGSTFDISIRRGGNGDVQNTNRTRFPDALLTGDAGYRQIIRLSRELATLLNIEYWASEAYFPKCTYDQRAGNEGSTNKKLRDGFLWMTEFSPDTYLYNKYTYREYEKANEFYKYVQNDPDVPTPPKWIQCYCEEIVDSWKQYLTDRYFSLTILHKNFTADTPILGGQVLKDKPFSMEGYSKDRGYKNWHIDPETKFEEFLKTDIYDGDYVDILVCTNHPTKIKFSSVEFYTKAAADAYYKSRNIPETPLCVRDQYRLN